MHGNLSDPVGRYSCGDCRCNICRLGHRSSPIGLSDVSPSSVFNCRHPPARSVAGGSIGSRDVRTPVEAGRGRSDVASYRCRVSEGKPPIVSQENAIVGDVRSLPIALPAGGVFRWPRRLTVSALWALGLAVVLLLVGSTATPFTAEMKVVPPADVFAAQLGVPGDRVAQDESRPTACPLCGQLVCRPWPLDDLLGASAPDSAVLSVNSAPPPVLSVLRSPRRYASGLLTPPCPTSFDPRGPPRST